MYNCKTVLECFKWLSLYTCAGDSLWTCEQQSRSENVSYITRIYSHTEREIFPFHIHSSVSLLMDPQIIILTPGSYCFTSLSVWLQSSHLHKYIRSVSCVHLACVVWNAIWLSVLMCNSVRPPVHSVLDQLYILFT